MHATQTAIARRTLLLALLLPAAVRASPWHTPEHHVHVPEGNDHGPLYNAYEGAISAHDTAVIQDYYKSPSATACPPNCPPPGQPRPWTLGQKLPATALAEPLPPDLDARLSPFYGYHYVRVGGDIVMLADGTLVVAAGMPILIR